MSYDPSQAAGARAIQIDIKGTSILSSDITAHTATSITARCKYYIESKYYVVVTSSVAGLILYYNWSNFQWAGATIRSNTITSSNTMTDDVFVGSNTPGTSLSMQTASVGTASVDATSSAINTFLWRIL